ncbi:type II toxin-antitoxin system HicA family toxin [Candidatus Kuenenbacteria bacterium]|nr:type II toxin-antitoxin system HicA family toxin [Candidatus Kuenenbacteria bacterium]
MSKISPVHYKKLLRVFQAEGFYISRQKGDHLILIKPGVSRPIIIPMYDEIPVFVIKNNLRTAGISREKYFQLLR